MSDCHDGCDGTCRYVDWTDRAVVTSAVDDSLKLLEVVATDEQREAIIEHCHSTDSGTFHTIALVTGTACQCHPCLSGTREPPS